LTWFGGCLLAAPSVSSEPSARGLPAGKVSISDVNFLGDASGESGANAIVWTGFNVQFTMIEGNRDLEGAVVATFARFMKKRVMTFGKYP
jgi:hypothetical protein